MGLRGDHEVDLVPADEVRVQMLGGPYVDRDHLGVLLVKIELHIDDLTMYSETSKTWTSPWRDPASKVDGQLLLKA